MGRFFSTQTLKDNPLLEVVMLEESLIGIIQHMPEILQWHALLFQVFGATGPALPLSAEP